MKRVLQTIFRFETLGYITGLCTAAVIITFTLVGMRILIGCFLVGYCH